MLHGILASLWIQEQKRSSQISHLFVLVLCFYYTSYLCVRQEKQGKPASEAFAFIVLFAQRRPASQAALFCSVPVNGRRIVFLSYIPKRIVTNSKGRYFSGAVISAVSFPKHRLYRGCNKLGLPLYGAEAGSRREKRAFPFFQVQASSAPAEGGFSLQHQNRLERGSIRHKGSPAF